MQKNLEKDKFGCQMHGEFSDMSHFYFYMAKYVYHIYVHIDYLSEETNTYYLAGLMPDTYFWAEGQGGGCVLTQTLKQR